MPIHYFSEGVVRVAEMVVESKLFTVQQALYFAVSIHVRPAAADAARTAAAMYHPFMHPFTSNAVQPACPATVYLA